MKKAPMPGGLVLVKQAQFGSLAIDCYTDGRGNFYMTRDQIGQALEYPHPRRAIETIHKRHKERLDRLSTVLKTRTVDGKEREVVLYQSRGVYEICRHSTQPKADAFYDCVYDILEGLRLGWLDAACPARIFAEGKDDPPRVVGEVTGWVHSVAKRQKSGEEGGAGL